MKDNKEVYLVLLSVFALLIRSILFARIVVLYIIVLCFIWGRKEKSFVNPYFLFAATPLSLFIYVNVSNQYMLDLTFETWGIAIINMVAFVLALRHTSDFRLEKSCKGPSDNKLLLHTLIFASIALFSSVMEYIMQRPFFLSSVLNLCSVPALICAIKSKKKVLIILVFLVFIVTSIGFLSKSFVLTYILATIIGFEKYIIKNERQKKNVVALTAVGMVIMVLSFTFANKDRGTRSAQDTVDYYTKYSDIEWNSPNALFMPYMYLTTPWANLQYLMESQDERTYGLWLFKPLLGYLQLDENYKPEYRMRAYSTFNTFTFISTNFKDFGYWLSILSSLLLGFFVKKVYSRYRKSRSPLDVACYVYVGLAVLEMFFSNEFFTQSFPFTIVIIMGLYKLFFFNKSKPQLESNTY